MIKNKRKVIDPIIILILSFIMIIPLLKNDVLYTGVDMGFHLNRAFDQYRVLQSGHLFSLINTYSLNHLGTPVNMAYGFIYLYPLALWMLIIHSKIKAVYLGIATILTIVGFIAYWIGNRFWNNRNKALTFAILYAFSTYTFDIFFGSFSLAQASAMIFLPCVAFGAYSIFFRDKSDWLILALGMTGTIYCHLISTLLYSTLIFAIIVIAFFLKKIDPSKLVALFKAIVVTILATSFYWLNFLYIYLNNSNINTPASNDISGNPTSDFVIILLTSILGTVISIAFIISLLNWGKLNGEIKLVGVLSMLYMFISLDISNFIWHFLNKTPIKHIQGVIRFRVIILFLVLVFIISASDTVFKKSNYSLLLMAILVCCTWLSSSYTFMSSHSSLVNVATYYSKNQSAPFANYKITSNTDFLDTVNRVYNGVGCLDYWPRQALQNRIALMNHRINGTDSHSFKTIPKFNGINFKSIYSKKPQNITLPFLAYKGLNYTITNNGHKIKYGISNNGCLITRLETGPNNINIQVKQSFSQKLTAIISLVTLLSIIGALIRKKIMK